MVNRNANCTFSNNQHVIFCVMYILENFLLLLHMYMTFG